MFRAAEQDAGDVRDKSVMEDAPALSLSTTIAGPSGSPRQVNQICGYPEREGVCGEVERIEKTSLNG